jgi:serine/threonine protein kinase
MEISNYLCQKKLGAGAFGSVYQASMKNSEELLALKIVKNEPKYFKASQREIQMLEKVNQLNLKDYPIVRMLDHFIENEIQYLVFELLDVNMYHFYKRNTITFKKTINIGKQVLMGLAFLHSLNIIHGDIKPENIMYDRKTEKVKIIDLGSSFYEPQKCENGYSVFYIQSRYYRAPEVIYEIKRSVAIDIWSLGCVLFEILFKKPLFGGKNLKDMVYMFTELIGIPPVSHNEYFSSHRFRYYFYWDSEYKTYVRKPYIYNYSSVNSQGLEIYLRRKLSKIGVLENEAESFIDLICCMVCYNYRVRLTALELLNLKIMNEDIKSEVYYVS